MAIFEVEAGGKSYEVEAPDASTAMRAIAGKMAPVDNRPTIDKVDDYIRAAANGMTFGLADRFAAKMGDLTGVGGDQGDYAGNLANEQGRTQQFREQNPIGAGAANIGGAIATVPLMGGLGVAGEGANLLYRTYAGLRGGAVLGGASGFGNSPDWTNLPQTAKDTLTGMGVGAAIGGGAPTVLSTAQAALSPITSNIAARWNPQNYARSQVARAVSESGRTPQQIADELAMAGQEGQGVYTAADAMGNAGQRMLSSVARAPGTGRTQVVEYLENRQAGQGRRIANQLAEGFESPQTAAQTEARLTQARGNAADAAYGAVRNDAGAVDVTPAIAHIDQTLGPGADQMLSRAGSAAANDSVESVLINFRNRLARTNPDDFASIQRIRGDMADAAQSAAQGGHNNRARLIRGAVAQLDNAMENASTGFRQANANFAQASRDIEAVQSGRDAAMRGRTEDVIPNYQGLGPQGQAAFRSGYVDPHIQQAQSAAHTANKARPLLNDAFAAESAAIAPGHQQLSRQLGRENTMFQTRNAAVGNSKTAENLADDAAMGAVPSLVGQALAGNWSGAARQALGAGSNVVTGNTPAVRQEIARLMLSNHATAADIQNLLAPALRAAARSEARQGRIGMGAAMMGPAIEAAQRSAKGGVSVADAKPTKKKKPKRDDDK